MAIRLHEQSANVHELVFHSNAIFFCHFPKNSERTQKPILIGCHRLLNKMNIFLNLIRLEILC